MSEYVLSCCSTADLTREHFERRDVRFICFHYFLNGTQYPDDFGQTVSFRDFYAAMANGAETSTSQINVAEYEAYFTSFAEQGKDVVHLSLSSGLSGSVQSARTAASIVEEQFPDRRIYVIDSLAASSGYGLFVDRLADLRDEGYTAEQLRDWAEENKLRLSHWFCSTDLTYFVRGGRISKTSGTVGGILGICPLMNVDDQGRLTVRKKVIGKKRVLGEMVERMAEHADNGTDYADECYICHSACEQDAKALAAALEERFPALVGRIRIYNIGTTIGSHSGPGTVALFFWGKPRG